jgi:hypothetical protein
LARWKWSIKGVAGICSLVSFVAGAAIAVAVWFSPDWAHQHISERMNAVVLGLIPLAAGASVFFFRWFISPYPIYKKLRAKIDAKQSRENIRRELYSYLLDLESRITDLRRLDAPAVAMFGMTPAETDKDNKRIDEIFKYITENISLSAAGEFLSSTGLNRNPRGITWGKLDDHVEFLTNRAIRLKRIVDGL